MRKILFGLAVLALLSLAALAVLNQGELSRTTELNLGWRTFQAPLGLVMLALAGVGLVLALVGAAWGRAHHRRQVMQLERDLKAQREIADHAEGSRMAELQRQLDLQAQAAQHREREWITRMDERLDRLQQGLQQQFNEVGNGLAASIGEVEDRLERRRMLRPPGEPPRAYERH